MNKDSFSSFLVGLGVGVGIGMLFAPKSGAETRTLIRNKADESKEYLRQRGAELKDSAGDLIEKGKEMVGRQRGNLADAMEAGRQAYRDAVGQPPPPPTPES
jgi:gas vesicle protein